MIALSELSELAASRDSARLGAFLDTLPVVDDEAVARDVAAAESAVPRDVLATLDTAVSMIDLTTLEGTDTPERVRALATRALHPDDASPAAPHTAAVCVYGDMASAAREVLSGGPVRLACVAGAFPSGRADIAVKRLDVEFAIAQGADEIDMVIDRGAFLDGNFTKVLDDIVALKAVCASAVRPVALKVILENSELGGLQNVSRASHLALLGGADFIKTSTGKVPGAATMPDVAVMLRAVIDWRESTGIQVGVKAAGGIRTAKEAIAYLQLVEKVAGADWLTPQYFRFGASSLLGGVVEARRAAIEGAEPSFVEPGDGDY